MTKTFFDDQFIACISMATQSWRPSPQFHGRLPS